jgi:general L-amino acid transport system permease protein
MSDIDKNPSLGKCGMEEVSMSSQSGTAVADGITPFKYSSVGLLTNKKFRAIVTQILVVVLLILFTAFIAHNTAVNLEKRGIATGFGFLGNPAGFDVAFSLIDYNPQMTHSRVYVVGAINTVLIAALGCLAATILGFIVGVLRLSSNWLVSRVAYWYVEILRNIPLLLQIIFWWNILILMPTVRNAISFGDTFYLSNKGFQLPKPIFEEGSGLAFIALIVAIVVSIAIRIWAHRRQEATGQIFPVWWTAFGLVIGLPLIVLAATGFPISFEIPVFKGFNFQGGLQISPEMFALWFALSVYTGAFIAEIVRAGIQAVSWGQTEAASALGLRSNWTMRLVIIPQAMRVIVPMLTSQYLNLTKNSSLALAIGYPDLVATFGNTSLNQTGQAVEIIAIVMATYLAFSLLTSVFMNWYNKRVALVER